MIEPKAETATTFAGLTIGAKFKFFVGGSTLTKTSEHSYAAPQWGQEGMPAQPGQPVIPVHRPVDS